MITRYEPTGVSLYGQRLAKSSRLIAVGIHSTFLQSDKWIHSSNLRVHSQRWS